MSVYVLKEEDGIGGFGLFRGVGEGYKRQTEFHANPNHVRGRSTVQISKQAHARKKTPAAGEPTDAQHYSRAAGYATASTQGQSAASTEGTQAQQIRAIEEHQFG